MFPEALYKGFIISSIAYKTDFPYRSIKNSELLEVRMNNKNGTPP